MPTPIVIGVGDFKNASKEVSQAIEPMQLMLNAIRISISDTGLSEVAAAKLKSQIDSIAIVRTWTWPYPDLPSLLSERLGINPSYKHYTDHGGNQPGVIFGDAARRISKGECKVAIVTGGEALASCEYDERTLWQFAYSPKVTACATANKMPPPGWPTSEKAIEGPFSPSTRELQQSMSNPIPVAGMDLTTNLFLKGLGGTHNIGAPIHVYPLFENGFRAHRGQSIQQNTQESAELYAEFAKVAEQNPFSWGFGKPAETAESIGTVNKKNRMICFPYPLLMNAFNTVNTAAACLLTSVEYAKEIGIPESEWIYPLGGAGTKDDPDCE
ncbi:hypothetical protein LTR47_011356 [Exophiala xenobiotica]|nr:hypothetical protein LTR47_011356 [Exophiala xenobiotica]KAK5243873.1 hypothetical protein LTS06_010443 [Exophiala xenobiotica]KAK5282070.1 hypothetical protein LTR40_003835 [Exophiala xenobiotica]KAK5357786.1 hypothetical protein LTS03_011446 [Exophiala xenobiotica]KAK5466197.1 hypothetical protein LTR55_011686 [Exophiala xenobiotica]